MNSLRQWDPTMIDRLSPARRPVRRSAGFHRWHDLLFLHWRVPLEVVAPLVPEPLEIDTCDGSAWIGLVPFRLSGVCPSWGCPLPGVSSFIETNVRTYVHLDGRDPGVWFFSLDASSALAVWVARLFWRLNYVWSHMSLVQHDAGIVYHGRRPTSGAGYRIAIETHAPNGEPPARAQPGTLEHFLIERYLFYSQWSSGQLRCGHVHHAPYELSPVRLVEFEQDLLAADGLPSPGEPEHIAFSRGVEVEIFPLDRIDRPLAATLE
jgi:hypothetical protein